MILRPYQSEAHEKLRHYYDKGYNRLLVHMATGLGKTTGVALHLPNTFPELEKNGLLFLAHRREILYQAYQKFKRHYPNKWIGIEMGEYHATGMEDYVFASVDSIGRLMSDRINNYNRRKFGIVITDEGHHATEDSIWDNILTYFGVGSDPSTHYRLGSDSGYGDKPLSVFLTATPERSDGQPLTPFVDDVGTESGAAASYDILYGIKNGWLVGIEAYQAYTDQLDLENVDPSDPVAIDYLVKAYKKYAEGRRTLVFARRVEQSRMLVDTLNRHGIVRAAHVDHNTPKEERDVVVPEFLDGDIMLLSNRLVFTEGYDNPNIEAIIDNAPTQSTPLHIQKIGRGLRPHTSVEIDQYHTAELRKEAIRNSPKPYLLYIATFNPAGHKLDITSTIFGTSIEAEADSPLIIEEVVDIINRLEEEQPERPVRDITTLAEAKLALKKVDVWTQTVYNDELKALTDLRWIYTAEWAALYLPKNPSPSSPFEQTPLIVRFKKRGNVWHFEKIIVGGWVEQLNRPVRHKREQTELVARDLHDGIVKVDKWLRDRYPKLYARMMRGREDAPANEKQIKYLKANGIRFNEGAITESTAQLLKDNFRVTRKLDQLKIR